MTSTTTPPSLAEQPTELAQQIEEGKTGGSARTTPTVQALWTKRTELLAERERLQTQVSDLTQKQRDIDATLITLGIDLDRKATVRETLCGENNRATLEVLRRASRRLTSSEIARQVLVLRGLDFDDRKLALAMTKRVRVILRQYQQKGVLTSRLGKYPHLEWSFA